MKQYLRRNFGRKARLGEENRKIVEKNVVKVVWSEIVTIAMG